MRETDDNQNLPIDGKKTKAIEKDGEKVVYKRFSYERAGDVFMAAVLELPINPN